MNSEPPEHPRREPTQGMTAHLIAGLGAAAGFGLVTWWQSEAVGPTIVMAIAAFIVAFAVSRISQSRGR